MRVEPRTTRLGPGQALAKSCTRAVIGLFVLLLAMLAPRTQATIAGEAVKLSAQKGAVSSRKAASLYYHLPLSFELNRGQTDPQVKYLARGPGYTLFLTGDEAVLSLSRQKPGVRSQKVESRPWSVVRGQLSGTTDDGARTTAVLGLKLVGANRQGEAVGLEELPGKSNYFLGNDPQQWRTDVPNYARVRYREVYPGVDVIYYGNQQQLEYDFVVSPGADPKDIRLAVGAGLARPDGAQPHAVRYGAQQAAPLRIDRNGDLVIQTEGGEVRFHKPLAYQVKSPGDSRESAMATDRGQSITDTANRQSSIVNRQWLDVRYILTADQRIHFKVSGYDKSRPLIIDPVLSYATYVGGSGGDAAYSIAVDGSGNAFVAGSTASADFPIKSALQSASGGAGDAFVTKFNAAGSAFIYSTYLGGSGSDTAAAIAIDSNGNAYVAGSTASPNFPVTSGAPQTTYGGSTDAFLAKLNAAGSALVYSTYLGGSASDYARGVAVDSSENTYVTGATASPDFPTLNPLQVGNAGCSTTVVNGVSTVSCSTDAFVTKVNPSGNALLYSTYLGGAAADVATAIAVDGSGNAYLCGYTFSTDFPTQSALQSTNAGGGDVFVTEINATGSTLVYSTYLGGSGQDRAFGLALDAKGSVYVTGDTLSVNFPTTSNAFQATNQGQGDAFVFKLAPGGASLAYSTLLGGTGTDQGAAIAVDAVGNAYLTGFTQSGDFPTLDPLQAILGISGAGTCPSNTPGTTAPCPDAFVGKLSSSGALVYSTYLGGSGAEFGQAIAVDTKGAAYVAGSTTSSNFPAIAGAAQGSFAGTSTASNAFVAKIDAADAPAVALIPQQINFGNQPVHTSSDPQTVTLINPGSKPLNITGVTTSGDFAQTNTCGTAVPAGGSYCTIQITFTPTIPGGRTDEVTITDNAQGSPQNITVTGTGVIQGGSLKPSPAALTFPAEPVGASSPSQNVLLTNNGTVAVTLSSITISGDFTETNTCGNLPSTLNVGASCTITVTFSPTGSGNRTGSLSITDDAANSPQNVSLTGTGQPLFSLSLNTRSTIIEIGQTSTTFTVSASAPSSFVNSITLSCSTTSGATCSFNPTSIMAGQTSTLTVSGLSATSPNPSDLTVAGTSSSQTANVSLAIFFADFSIAASPNLNTISAGQSTTYTITVSPTYGFNYVVLLGCSNLPQATTCTWSPPGVTLDGKNPFTSKVAVTTTTQSGVFGRRGPPPGNPSADRLWWVFNLGAVGLMMLMLSSLGRRIARRAGISLPPWVPAVGGLRLAALALILSLWALGTGCNQYVFGPNIQPAPITGTPTGNYTITLTGTLGNNNSVAHNTTVNLSVGPG